MGDRRLLENAVPEIEDVRTVGERVKDETHCSVHLVVAREQRQWIEIALHRKAAR